MTTLASWFADELQARQAVLDLLTGGIPRDQISAVVGAGQGSQAEPPDFVVALLQPGAYAPADLGPAIAAGPLAPALVGQSLSDALTSAGVPSDEARALSDGLRGGGALVAVLADGAHEQVVRGVFRHSANPALRAQEELAGPRPLEELGEAEASGTLSRSFGAMTSGQVPGGWGDAAASFEELPDQAPVDEPRRREADL